MMNKPLSLISLVLFFVALLTGCSGTNPQIVQMTAEARAKALLLTATPTPTLTLTPTLTPTVTSTPTATPMPDTYKDAKGIIMRAVPAGEFTMGFEGYGNNHQVTLDAYFIDQYEVTNAAYKNCVDAGQCIQPYYTETFGKPEFDDFPVVNVDWNMSSTYCAWRGARLPSEAEWEKAARGTDGRTYPWGEGIDCDKANYNDMKCVGKITKVGSYENGKSPYGLYDMVGNVDEWINDWYDEDYYEQSPLHNPLGPTSGKNRSTRGGAYFLSGDLVTTYLRSDNDPKHADLNTGFRCARSAK